MRTAQIKIEGQVHECVLLAGGPGFKVYTTPHVDGWVLKLGRKVLVTQDSIVGQYVNYKYQPVTQQTEIKVRFLTFVEMHSKG